MSRPFYCSKDDVAREAAITKEFVRFLERTGPTFTWDWKPSARGENFDATIYRDGKAVAVVEIRSRFGDYQKHAFWHTAKAKIDRSRARAAQLGLPLILIVTWDNDYFFVRAEKLDGLNTHVSGRYDRNDPMDVEEMILMPPSIFNRF